MIHAVGWREYARLLEAFNDVSAEEALEIARDEYRKQWGRDPEQHEREIQTAWDSLLWYPGVAAH